MREPSCASLAPGGGAATPLRSWTPQSHAYAPADVDLIVLPEQRPEAHFRESLRLLGADLELALSYDARRDASTLEAV